MNSTCRYRSHARALPTPVSAIAPHPGTDTADLADRQRLAGQAQTGTGKTAAFLVTLFTRLLKNTAYKYRRIPGP